MWEITGGSMIGREHVRAQKNNQDAYCWIARKDFCVAVVADGCGSGKHSEVGACIGARYLTNWIASAFCGQGIEQFLEMMRQDMMFCIKLLANPMGRGLSETISDYFLFTVLGVLIAKEKGWVFSIGDGAYLLDSLRRIGPFEENEPPYLAYGITGSSVTDRDPGLLKFRVHEEFSGNIIIGTDGVLDLARAQEKKMPGREEKVGPLDQFLEDKYFKNPDMLRRRLSLISRDVTRVTEEGIVKENGLLPDDTTLVAIRRR